MIGLCLLLLPVMVWAGTFTDDFNDGDMDGWVKSDVWGVGASWEVNNGVLVGTSGNPKGIDTQLYLIQGMNWVDYQVSARVRIVSTFSPDLAGGGLLIRQTANRQQYMAYKPIMHDTVFKPEGPHIRYLLMRGGGGNWVIESEPYEFETGIWYELQVEVSGNRFVCHVDGEEVMTAEHNEFLKGSVGFTINGAKVQFDDFTVTGNDVPDPEPDRISVEPSGKLAKLWGGLKAN
jgi:hypothetical protein